ncbi:hypothetical protein ACFCP7_23200 [Paenibacillus elgii]
MNGKISVISELVQSLTACRALKMEITDEQVSPIDVFVRKEAGHELLESVMSLDVNHRTVVIFTITRNCYLTKSPMCLT